MADYLKFVLCFLICINDVYSEIANMIDEEVITTKAYVFWPNATIPFYIDPNHFDHEQALQIMSAFSTFAFKTCLKFAPVMARPEGNEHVMLMENPAGIRKCYVNSDGISIDEPHRVILGYDCIKSPNIDMVIMKALGFPFEHNRAIRDLYIQVQEENVEPGYIDLYTKDIKLPLELRSLPYDPNSVTHFGERDFSKNGHRTIIFKKRDTKQDRRSLSSLDIRKIEIVYGPECRKRDRQEKIDLCQNYPGVARRKRDVSSIPVRSLRVNPNITPPSDIMEQEINSTETSNVNRAHDDVSIDETVTDLGIDVEIEELVTTIHKVAAAAMKNAREKYCSNNDTKITLRAYQQVENHNNTHILNIVGDVLIYTQAIVNSALSNKTEFCEPAVVDDQYQRSCPFFNKDRCPKSYKSTKPGLPKFSTQHRPVYKQSTKNVREKKNHLMAFGSRAGNDSVDLNDTVGGVTEELSSVTPGARRKREAATTLAIPETSRTTSPASVDSESPVAVRSTNSAPNSSDSSASPGVTTKFPQPSDVIKNILENKSNNIQHPRPDDKRRRREIPVAVNNSLVQMETPEAVLPETETEKEANATTNIRRFYRHDKETNRKWRREDRDWNRSGGSGERAILRSGNKEKKKDIFRNEAKGIDMTGRYNDDDEEEDRKKIKRGKSNHGDPRSRTKDGNDSEGGNSGGANSGERNRGDGGGHRNKDKKRDKAGRGKGGRDSNEHGRSPRGSYEHGKSARGSNEHAKGLDSGERDRGSRGSNKHGRSSSEHGRGARGSNEHGRGSNEHKDDRSGEHGKRGRGSSPHAKRGRGSSEQGKSRGNSEHGRGKRGSSEHDGVKKSKQSDEELNDNSHGGSGHGDIGRGKKGHGRGAHNREKADISDRSAEEDLGGNGRGGKHASVESAPKNIPRTVPLTKKVREYYEERKWPDGVVRYLIKEDGSFEPDDVRKRLGEVNNILKKKTCARIEEITEAETESYEDYLVLDNSPDFVTGRVGGRQIFGVVELLRGGQHRQHAAMMVMSMLGFYFEVSRHDRDKYIRVHSRHVRPDKLHHFEKIREDATFPLPYDYQSATHPAWQFWRQIGKTGISTVATFKEKDPNGVIMKSMGQNEQLLSDQDIIKINTVYGTECFGGTSAGKDDIDDTETPDAN